MNTETTVPATSADKIKCEIDGAMVHSIQAHIKANHSETWTLKRYEETYPDAPILSRFAQAALEKSRREKEERDQSAAQAAASTVSSMKTGVSDPMIQANYQVTRQSMHEVFELGSVPAAMGSTGQPIPVAVLSGHTAETANYLPEVDKSYVFEIDLLKKCIMALTINTPMLLWGMHGTGKTSIVQQVAARTRRPCIRSNHTLNMEESHVLGQWIVKDGETQFQLGPLAFAMLFGLIYIADEYDMAPPSVVAVYQPVMEGQGLIIKDAPPHLRKITPHPDFRFFATGNTNGCGDETGLYQGTMMQNAANYSRFGITVEVHYMSEQIEENILRAKAGIPAPAAKKIVKFANDVRKSFRDGKISMTISPREMISAAKVGVLSGGNWTTGIELAFGNRLPRVDQQVVKDYLQRIFA
ncbi:AAA domain-containing protein [Rhodobacteraceae bacterium R_SAG4]|nr:AAA domain-containing protein [Rhodobacteraceae bacterium R_SAG4]